MDSKIRITYDASDPAAVRPSLDDPYVLPPGRARLWRRNGDEPRNKAGVDVSPSTGSYVPPGVYTKAQLGLSTTGTLYLEAVRPSDAVGDSSGFIHADTVRLTATRRDLFTRGYGQSEFETADQFVKSDLSAPPENGCTAGALQTYKYRVYDPRASGVTQLTIDGQELSLQRQQGGYYETPEFVTVSAGSAINWAVPYQHIDLSGEDAEVRASPGRRIRGVKPNPVPAQLDEYRTAIRAETAAMQADPTWRQRYSAKTDDATAHGKELHRRMALREMGGHWKHDVYVDMTTMKVVHIGPNPPPNTTNNANVQQIDHVCMAEIRRDVYHELTVGNVWDISKVASLHDLMASVKSWLEGKHLDRLAGGKGSGKLFTTVPEELYRKGKWVPNPSSQDLHRMFGFIGLAVSARIIALQMEVMADYWSVGEQLAKIRKREQPALSRPSM